MPKRTTGTLAIKFKNTNEALRFTEMASRGSAAAQFQQLSIGGANLAYTDTGRGHTIVLVHGNISDIRSWDSVVPLFASRFRAIAYSRRYAWPNDEIADGVEDPWENHADDLIEILEKLAVAPAHIVGNSTGATVALILAKKRPDLVKTMTLEEPPVIHLFLPTTPPSLMDVARLLWFHPWSFLPIMHFGAAVMGPTSNAFKKGDDETAVKIFLRGVLGAEFEERMSQERREQAKVNVKPHRALFCYGELPKFVDADAQGIEVPALVVNGEKTPTSVKHINRRLAALLLDAKEAEIQGASHFIHEDQPEELVRAVIEFVSEVSN
jgi:pimeloyl-ACP methyl ester carboxylesterase